MSSEVAIRAKGLGKAYQVYARPQDRLAAIEKHPEEVIILKQALAPWRKARVEEGDGYARLLALLPPPERRGLVLIDPPFEAPDEFACTLMGEYLARHDAKLVGALGAA